MCPKNHFFGLSTRQNGTNLPDSACSPTQLIRGADPFVWNSLDLSRNETTPSAPQKRISEIDGKQGLVYIPKVDDLPKKEEILKLKKILEQVFPEEIKEFEDVLRGQKNYECVTPKN
jgi:hypothetical protein